jgi:PKD domain
MRPTQATASPTPDFTIQVSPSSITVPHNLGLSVNITVTSINNFAGTITLASTASLPTGPGPTSVSLTANSTMTSVLFFDTYFVPPGDYPVNITGTSGTLEHSTTLNIILVGPDFQISSSQTTVTEVPRGFILNASKITITSLNNFSGPVRFFAYSLGPPFIQTEFSPGTVTLPTNGTASSELTILGSQPGTQPGTYSLVVGASNVGSLVSLTHTTTIQLRIKHTIGPTVTIGSVSTSQKGTQTTVTVNFSTTDPDGTVESFNIYWGDDTSSFNLPGTTAVQSHAYNSLGTFTIIIIARDSSGAISPPATKILNLNTPSSSAALGLINLALASPVLYSIIGTTIAAIISAMVLVSRRKSTTPTQ